MTQLEPQVFVGRAAPTADAIKPVTNEKFWKPVGGLWTSTLNHEGGEWLRWLLSEIFTRYDWEDETYHPPTVEDLQVRPIANCQGASDSRDVPGRPILLAGPRPSLLRHRVPRFPQALVRYRLHA